MFNLLICEIHRVDHPDIDGGIYFCLQESHENSSTDTIWQLFIELCSWCYHAGKKAAGKTLLTSHQASTSSGWGPGGQWQDEYLLC